MVYLQCCRTTLVHSTEGVYGLLNATKTNITLRAGPCDERNCMAHARGGKLGGTDVYGNGPKQLDLDSGGMT